MRAKLLFNRLLALAAGTLLLVGGCHRDSAKSAASTAEPIHVLTTVYALADVVRQIGGDRVTVEWFIESGQTLDDLKETPERRQQFRNADLIVTRGAADPWTLEGMGNSYNQRRIVRVDALPSSREGDPTHYMWLDPQTIVELTDEIATRLSTTEPENEKLFKANATRFRAEVLDISDRARPILDATNLQFLTIDRGFLPLARRFGLINVEVPKQVTLSDPSPYGVKVLKQLAKSVDARSIFTSTETPITLIHDWESRLGLKVLPMDALGSSAPSGRSTYTAILQYNLDQLMNGLKGTRATTRGPTTRQVTQ